MELSAVIQHTNSDKLKWLKNVTSITCKKNNIPVKIQIYIDQRECFDAAIHKGVNLIILPGNVEGLKLGKQIRITNKSAVLVYIDSDMSHVLDAFERLPIAYLPQDFTIHQFAQVLFNSWKWLGMQNENLLKVKTKHTSLRIRQNEIEYIESHYRQVIVHLSNGSTHTFLSKLDDVETQLDARIFCRCHQSYLINLMHIDRIDHAKREVFFLSGATAFASKAHIGELLSRIEK